MVKEEIVLGHTVSKNVIEDTKEMIEVIEKFPPPIPMKGINSFLGHAYFYHRFIKDFSTISILLFKLFEKDIKFVFYDVCLRKKLILVFIINSIN